MGYKLSLILGGLFLATASASYFYINKLHDDIAVLKGNQLVLKQNIKEQNAQIKEQIARQEKIQNQIVSIEKEKQEALREVNQLRNTFAKHDLDNLALAKPKLIENIVNKGTKKVKEELIALTNPDQFNEEDITD